ncbi:arginine decarboxylase-like isoform X2 [Salvia hispanica]|uniref:arginine decarboxylase-like isoform X2 n=1 Tax=Salvia hispanica TaxID=49212 RepID=UPI002009C392|nr:arginine decarboxylase-like isoform X2 [Salvia hispanica]
MQSLSVSNGANWSFRLTTTPRGCISQQTFCVAFGNKKEHKEHGGSLELDPTDGLVDSNSRKLNESRLPPLVSALKASAEENAASFHFPGHNRGQAAPSSLARLIGARPFLHDLPELPELDNLFAPEGPILEAQKQAAELFGASETWFLVGGSTCGVQAAIMATCSPRDVLILPRNSHISAISAMVLSGVVPKYIVPEYDPEWDIAGGITPSQVEKAIKELETEGLKPAAVFVVSPSYHGVCSDIGAISELCHRNDIPVIVDEAHGAHFGFHDHLPASALAQAADIVVQSTHKVLCSLTQSSMLHLSSNLIDRERICRCLQMLQSSSPSYLLLASLDAATAQLSDRKGTIFNEAMELALETRDFGVISELVGTQSIALAFNLGTKREHASRLLSGLKYLSETLSHANRLSAETEANATALAPFDDFNVVLNPRDAFFARKRKVSFEDSLGKICGELICPYPPGIPVVIPGEVVTETALKYLMHVKSKGATISGAADRLLSSLIVCDV